ncbi:MAG TPA: hypothetical protein PLK46_13210 [Propioniciclava sp.]|jgi:hypothetical protein|uniref:hypothetical protein n=1 Tax=Propioniciclava sp. TaxID=2038686 RepID=UPI002CFF6EEA|nr:hypothetical protein [Propioniciclava sp.]HRL49602.1 hypothetical protein [Propioniciclava sp.]HRL81275.1 hypothetical protein [Propioniciclava sp.]
MSGTAASTKVWRRLGSHARDALLRGLGDAELRAILADIARARAGALTPADIIKRWREDRLLAPSTADPRAVLALTQRLWDALPPEFAGVTLSPLTSLGTGSHLGGRGQNRVITTVRGSELVADPAHALALEASKQRRTGHARVHLATHARATHASDPGEGAAHELIFSLCSSAPDGGGLSTEAELLDLHLSYWQAALATLVPSVEVHLLVWDTSLAALLEGRGVLDRVTVTKGADPTPWRNPYATAAFRLVASGEHPVVLGDGGFVPWTQALTRNRKDRCLVSGISVDALVQQHWIAEQ